MQGCGRKHKARGWCKRHYIRWRLYGDVFPGVPFSRTNRFAAPTPPDEVAVLRAVNGDPPDHLRPVERRAAVACLTARGLSARVIAERLGVTPRAVQRHRTQLRAGEGLSAPCATTDDVRAAV